MWGVEVKRVKLHTTTGLTETVCLVKVLDGEGVDKMYKTGEGGSSGHTVW